MREELVKILGIQTESYDTTMMDKYIINEIHDMGLIPVLDNGNIYVTKGLSDTYPCIVSHTDSVHKIIPPDDFTIIANDKFAIGFDNHKMSPSGCGGDDKVGIYICLELLKTIDCIKVAFFRDEEVGCVGSYEADVKFFNDVRFILQCDRKGNQDFVNEIYGTQLQSKRFKKMVSSIIESYDYHFASGMLTDVYALTQLGVGVSVANMSCGYYNPHCDDEIVCFEDVERCLCMCQHIMEEMTERYECHHQVKPSHTYNTSPKMYGRYYDWDGLGWGDSDWDIDTTKKDIPTPIDLLGKYDKCQGCDEWIEIDKMQFVRDFNCEVCPSCREWAKV